MTYQEKIEELEKIREISEHFDGTVWALTDGDDILCEVIEKNIGNLKRNGWWVVGIFRGGRMADL